MVALTNFPRPSACPPCATTVNQRVTPPYLLLAKVSNYLPHPPQFPRSSPHPLPPSLYENDRSYHRKARIRPPRGVPHHGRWRRCAPFPQRGSPHSTSDFVSPHPLESRRGEERQEEAIMEARSADGRSSRSATSLSTARLLAVSYLAFGQPGYFVLQANCSQVPHPLCDGGGGAHRPQEEGELRLVKRQCSRLLGRRVASPLPIHARAHRLECAALALLGFSTPAPSLPSPLLPRASPSAHPGLGPQPCQFPGRPRVARLTPDLQLRAARPRQHARVPPHRACDVGVPRLLPPQARHRLDSHLGHQPVRLHCELVWTGCERGKADSLSCSQKGRGKRASTQLNVLTPRLATPPATPPSA